MKTFEQYLKEKCFELSPLENNISDDNVQYWIDNLDSFTIMVFAKDWMNEYRSFIRQTVHEVTK